MSLHYLDPEQEPRNCPHRFCAGCGAEQHESREFAEWPSCQATCSDRETFAFLIETCKCNGTGRLGVEIAKPDVRIDFMKAGPIESGFYFTFDITANIFDANYDGPFPTIDSALEEARKVRRE